LRSFDKPQNLNNFFFSFLDRARDLTQGLMHARLALYHIVASPVPKFEYLRIAVILVIEDR
jgi:hypothetical protein